MVPLLAALSAAQTSVPASAPSVCPILMLDRSASARIPLADSDAKCVAAKKIFPHFARLREKAAFAETELSFILTENHHIGASFDRTTKPPSVRVKTGLLLSGQSTDSLLYILAHEISHAVQNRGPESHVLDAMLARLQKEGDPFNLKVWNEWVAIRRRYEAQADGIAQQLLLEAGYPTQTLRLGSEEFLACSKSMEPLPAHPAPAQRLLNASSGQEIIARRVQAAMTNPSSAFDGSRGHLESGPVVQPAPAFVPIVKLSDYDDTGVLKVGRLVAADLRVPPPKPDAGVVREFVQSLASSVVDYWIAEPFEAAVNKLLQDRSATEMLLEACGTPQARLAGQDVSLWAWTKRLAREGARKIGDLLRS